MGRSVIGGTVAGVRPPPVAYSGPGDVVSSSFGWWGLRAYSSASVGSNAVRLRRDSDNVESNFATISGGGLDISAISSFKGAANLFVVKLYDQSGAANDMVQATAAAQPAFSLTLGPGSTPTISLPTAANVSLTTTISFGPATFSTSHVARFDQPGGAGDARVIQGTGSFRNTYGITVPNTIFIVASSPASATASDNTIHAIQGVYNPASSSAIITVDGVDTTSDVGALFAMSTLILFQDGGAGSLFTGTFQEVGLWPGAFTGPNRTGLNSNQHSFWGF